MEKEGLIPKSHVPRGVIIEGGGAVITKIDFQTEGLLERGGHGVNGE